MEFKDNTIIIRRELSDLDRFALDFLKVLTRHTPYVVISGYVAILLGRARSSEDVDVLIPRMDEAAFSKLDMELKETGFYCLNAEQSAYDYLKDGIAVRYAKVHTVIPNMELKFSKNVIDAVTLKNTIRIRLNEEQIVTSCLEMQIAFKEKVLRSPKDLEDARHMRNVAQGHLDLPAIENYTRMLDELC